MPIRGRGDGQDAFVEGAEEMKAEANLPAVVVTGDEANGFLGEDFGEVEELSAPFELAVVPHPSHRHPRRVFHLRQPVRIGSGGGEVDLSGSEALQGLVRALPVELLDKGIETPLLLRKSVRRRLDGRRLQRPVHSLMPPILARLGRSNPLRSNPQPHPPLGQMAQTTRVEMKGGELSDLGGPCVCS